MLVDTDDADAVEAGRVVDQDPLALGEDGAVGGVPGHGQCLGEAGDGEVLADEADQGPSQCGPGQLGARLGCAARVLAPDVAAAGALVAADGDEQRRGAPAQRLVRQPPGHRVPRSAFAAALPAPPVGLDDPAGEHRPVRLDSLSKDLKAELVEAAERREVRSREGSVKHVEVFLDGCVRTSILGRPRPLPAHRRADPSLAHCPADYTLN